MKNFPHKNTIFFKKNLNENYIMSLNVKLLIWPILSPSIRLFQQLSVFESYSSN